MPIKHQRRLLPLLTRLNFKEQNRWFPFDLDALHLEPLHSGLFTPIHNVISGLLIKSVREELVVVELGDIWDSNEFWETGQEAVFEEPFYLLRGLFDVYFGLLSFHLFEL